MIESHNTHCLCLVLLSTTNSNFTFVNNDVWLISRIVLNHIICVKSTEMFQFLLFRQLYPIPHFRLFLSAESTNEKDVRSSGLTVTPRKTSQVNKEELAGKEALSKQYLKEDGNKRVGHTHKDASVGNQTTPKSSISTARSGIPGRLINFLPMSSVHFHSLLSNISECSFE